MRSAARLSLSSIIDPRRLGLPVILTAAILLAALFPAPALTNPTGQPVPLGIHLVVPLPYLLAGPLFGSWDAISMLSQSRMHGFVTGVGVLYLLWRLMAGHRRPARTWGRQVLRELLVACGGFLAFAIYLLVGALWHRPMIRLAGVPSDVAVVDYHSHTNVSHDVRGTLVAGFDAEANRRWHARAGFDAAFITDHNTIAGWVGHLGGSPELCPGVEVSAYGAHIVLLGDTLPVHQPSYDGSLDSLLALLRESASQYGSIAIASIPEYARNHWQNLPRFLDAGLGGFEVVNAAPKANELSRAKRDSVIVLARNRDRLILGVSDEHGWGATNMAWTLSERPGWKRGQPVCGLLLDRLRHGGFAAFQILERHRLRPEDRWPLWLTPIGAIWELWRSMGWPLTVSWLAWTWTLTLGSAAWSRRRANRQP